MDSPTRVPKFVLVKNGASGKLQRVNINKSREKPIIADTSTSSDENSEEIRHREDDEEKFKWEASFFSNPLSNPMIIRSYEAMIERDGDWASAKNTIIRAMQEADMDIL